MKRKLIVISIFYVIISIFGCHQVDIMLHTKILTFDIHNGTHNYKNAIEMDVDTMTSKKYCLIMKIKYSDSVVSKTVLDKKSASISLINSCYAAYDPPTTPHYQLIDSLTSFSMFNISKGKCEIDTINNLFNIYYSSGNVSDSDSLGSFFQLIETPLFLTINSILKTTESHYNYPYLNFVFIPKKDFVPDNQKFMILAKFSSGKIFIDSTKAIVLN